MNAPDAEDNPLKALAKSQGRTLKSLTVLSAMIDPYLAKMACRVKAAEWAVQVFADLNISYAVHGRRVFYKLVSQPTPVMMPNGEPFENTVHCAMTLYRAIGDAKYLGLIPSEQMIDRRNPEAVINFSSTESPADISVDSGSVATRGSVIGCWYDGPELQLPGLSLQRPEVAQRYQIEIWCEKSTVDDVLQPLGRQYGVNVQTGKGEISETRCRELLERARQHGRKVRVLYLSDFDPGGQSMPVAAARKIEFWARGGTLDDAEDCIQVIPILLSHEQCIQYRLPRTPLKDTECRAKKFEERYGEGATELDALEALHPGELRCILIEHIERYYDADLQDKVDDACSEVEDDLDDVPRQHYETN